MADTADEVSRLTSELAQAVEPRPTHVRKYSHTPKRVGNRKHEDNWTPGYEMDTEAGTGEGLSVPYPDDGPTPDDAAMMAELGVPPGWVITNRRESRWQRYDGEWLRASRITLRRADLVVAVPTLAEVEELRAFTPAVRRPKGQPHGTFMVALGDLQVGKVDNKLGTKSLIHRVAAATADVVARLRDAGHPAERIILLHAGDCIEGITSQGGRLVTKQDLSLTQQIELYTQIIKVQAAELAPLCEQLDISVVPGNHDETTRQFETVAEDSWAILAAKQAGAVLDATGQYPHVSWHFPPHDRLAVEFNVGTEDDPFYLAMVHGHKIATSANTIMRWWKDAAFGNQPGANARLLITGHYHHFRMEVGGDGKLWLQVPAMDGGSSWFVNKKGEDAPPGVVTFWLDQHETYPIQDLRIHSKGFEEA